MNDSGCIAPHLSHPKYRPDIDGLRAVAILSVVAYHTIPSHLPGGFIGVDAFFVISGYLISTILFQNLERDTFSFFVFYERRIRRIFPALIFVLTTCLVFGWFTLFAYEYKQLGKHVAASVGFVQNFVLWQETGYFDNASETKPLLHLWSLGVEEQFYLVWPLLIWFAWRRKYSLPSITLLMAAISFALNMYVVNKDLSATFYSPQTRFWELFAGSFLAWLVLYKKSQVVMMVDRWSNFLINRELWRVDRKDLSNVSSVLGFGILLYGFWGINKELRFPGYWALLPVISTIMVIVAGPQGWVNKYILSNRLVVWIGLISYPLYLWHWPLLSFARIMESEVPSGNVRIVAVLISIFLAWLTYKVIERPMRFGSHGRSKACLLVLFAAFVGYMGYNVYAQDGYKDRNSDVQQQVKAQEQFTGPHWPYMKNELCLNQYPYEDASKLAWWFCMKSGAQNPTIILMGNSFANELYPGFATNPLLRSHVILSIGTCDFAGLDGNPDPAGPCYKERQGKQNNYIDNLVEKEKSIKYAVIDGLIPEPDHLYIESTLRRIEKLNKLGIKVIIFTPHLTPGFDTKSCLARPFMKAKNSCEFSIVKKEEAYLKFMPAMEAISKVYPTVSFFDQNVMYCQSDTCSYLHNGLPLFRDEGHISEYGSVYLQKYFTDWAKINVPGLFNEGESQ